MFVFFVTLAAFPSITSRVQSHKFGDGSEWSSKLQTLSHADLTVADPGFFEGGGLIANFSNYFYYKNHSFLNKFKFFTKMVNQIINKKVAFNLSKKSDFLHGGWWLGWWWLWGRGEGGWQITPVCFPGFVLHTSKIICPVTAPKIVYWHAFFCSSVGIHDRPHQKQWMLYHSVKSF